MAMLKHSFHTHHWFSSSTQSSSLPWISPIHHLKTTSPKSDAPPKATTELQRTQKKQKFLSHESAIELIKRQKDPQRALEIFNNVSKQKGFNHNNATYSIILHKLGQSKKFKAVDALVHQMKYEACKFHESIFLNLMGHFSKCSLHDKVVEMFNAIQPIAREKPSVKAVSTCLNLLVESNQIDLTREFLLNVKKAPDFEPNTCIFNILVKHHCKNGDFESAFDVVKVMKKSRISYPNLITYSTLMKCLCENRRLKEAVDLFEEMVSKDQILPDALTYNILINGFCQAGKVDRAKKIMEFMRNNGCIPNLFNYSALMNGLCKEGRVHEAEEVFNEIKNSGLKPDTIVYTTLINCLCRAGRLDEAIELLKEMREKGCRADTVTINVVLGGLCRERRFEEALGMIERLPYEGVYLNKSSYRITLNFLCKYDEIEKATQLLRLMLGRGFVPHFATSNELLVRLCEGGKVADAALALVGLLEMRFKPEPNSWMLLVEMICQERKLLPVYELLDRLILGDLDKRFMVWDHLHGSGPSSGNMHGITYSTAPGAGLWNWYNKRAPKEVPFNALNIYTNTPTLLDTMLLARTVTTSIFVLEVLRSICEVALRHLFRVHYLKCGICQCLLEVNSDCTEELVCVVIFYTVFC